MVGRTVGFWGLEYHFMCLQAQGVSLFMRVYNQPISAFFRSNVDKFSNFFELGDVVANTFYTDTY